MEHGQKYARYQDKQGLGYRRHEQPPFLSMGVVGETKAQPGKYEAEEEESAEGYCCKTELTSRGMQTGENDGQNEGISASRS